MKWLLNLIKKIFVKKNIKLIEEAKNIDCKNNRDDFRIKIGQTADLGRDDGNGYKIIKKIKLKDMI